MSLVLALLLLQDLPRPVLPDPFAADAHRNDITYRSEMKRVLPLLDQEETRAAGDLEVRDLVEKFPGSPLLHYERGCYFARDRKWERAVREWEEAVFADDGRTVVSVRSFEGLAVAETARGRADAAIRSLERLAAAIPLSYRIHNRLAEALAGAGRMEKARRAWERSFALNPGQPDLQKRLGFPAPPKRPVEELPALLKRLDPSIVRLQAGKSRFTGFIALSKGWIVTCAHGMEDETSEVDVRCAGAKEAALKGRVHFRDAKRDLAVIHCPDLPAEAPVLPLVSAEGMQPGEKVYTLGHPGLGEQLLDLTPSEGFLATAHRDLEGMVFLQSSINVNPGNSGGPLVNRLGEVIGVVVLKSYLDGVAFAVPASELADALGQLSALHAPIPSSAEAPKK
ncbi:MAG TPA: trypsin-like peptidase domain-containing protein [Planctomycetota bacterium]|nr:trypsin-like peptidase domain-containing protein [Planctomycetota bacterium]